MSTVDFSNADTTVAIWDVCMSNTYCKYPVIVGVVVGSLVILTIVFCLARCLCCGGHCCRGCMRCGRSSSKKRQKGSGGGYDGFQPGPPPPVPYSPQTQYSSPQQPMYEHSQPSSYRGAQTATFVAPSKTPVVPARYNEDSLPAMPSWSDAKTKHVEEEHVEMERLHTPNRAQAQAQPHLLSGYDDPAPERFSGTTNYAPSGYAQSGGYAQSAAQQSRSSQQGSQYGDGLAGVQPQPYSPNAYMPPLPHDNDYEQQQPQYGSPRSPSATRSLYASRSPAPARSPHPPRSPVPATSPHPPRSADTARSPAPPSLRRTPSQSTAGQGSVLPLYSQSITPSSTGYAPSTIAPSYHTRSPSASAGARSPPPQPPTEYGGYMPRKPVQGSWRDV